MVWETYRRGQAVHDALAAVPRAWRRRAVQRGSGCPVNGVHAGAGATRCLGPCLRRLCPRGPRPAVIGSGASSSRRRSPVTRSCRGGRAGGLVADLPPKRFTARDTRGRRRSLQFQMSTVEQHKHRRHTAGVTRPPPKLRGRRSRLVGLLRPRRASPRCLGGFRSAVPRLG